jgi:hypothetical protein
MIALKQGNLDEARRVFEIGLHRSPFYEQRKYFSNGQALAMLRLGRFQEAVTYTKAGTDSVARIYRFHAYLALGDELKARAEYRAANDNDLLPHIRALSDGLARKYQLFEYGKVPSDEWIADQEAAILLQAA